MRAATGAWGPTADMDKQRNADGISFTDYDRKSRPFKFNGAANVAPRGGRYFIYRPPLGQSTVPLAASPLLSTPATTPARRRETGHVITRRGRRFPRPPSRLRTRLVPPPYSSLPPCSSL
jgi:hypothetical protein